MFLRHLLPLVKTLLLICTPAAALAFPFGMKTSRRQLQERSTCNYPPARRFRLVFRLALSRTDGGNGDDPLHSFAAKRELESRLDKLQRTAGSTLGGFYEPNLNSFSLKPGSVQGLSITSTCYALLAIVAGNGEAFWDSISTTSTDTRNFQLQPILRALLESNWREDDLFQVPLLLSTLLLVDEGRNVLSSGMTEESATHVRRLVESVLSARPRRRLGANGQRYSDYILFLCTQAYASLREASDIPSRPVSFGSDDDDKKNEVHLKEVGIGGLPLQALPEGAASSLSTALNRCAEVSANELYRQLALHTAGDNTDFDVMRLAYSLLTYLVTTRSLAGTAGLELVPGQGPMAGSRIGPANPKLVRAALKVFFDEQLSNGLWDKGQPIYKSFRKQGRNVGNAFVFSVDTIGSLLEALPCEEFRPYLRKLERTLSWVEDHQTVEVIPDYCDVESGQCYGKPIRGWSSPHLSPDTSPLAWSTAQVLAFVSRLRRRVRELMHRDVLDSFRGVSFSEEGPVNKYWDRLLDSDLGPRGTDDDSNDSHTGSRTLKRVLHERVIEPFSVSVDSPSFGAAYSAILFGPPGTAKTTICESLARKMGWDFLVVDTSVFLADGSGNVASRIRYVFERLQVLDRCVILFDEVEEFCLDRETPGIGMESRMLTTAMLTAINDLRRAKRSVFFLATNRLRALDSAITRPGRFDMQLFVGTPNLESRCIQFQQQLSKMSLDETMTAPAVASYRSFLSQVWKGSAMFMNYLEGLQFARACADIVATGASLANDDMARILEAQAAVMTVRGTARDEFLASMELSRL